MMEYRDLFTRLPSIIRLCVFLFVFLITSYLTYDILTKARNKEVSDQGEDTTKAYQDEDGVASDESQKERSVTLTKYFTLASVLAGVIISFSFSINATIASSRNLYVDCWVSSGSWALILLISVYVQVQRDWLVRYRYGLFCATASGAVCVSECFRLRDLLPRKHRNVLFVLEALQLVAAAVACFTHSLIPRRPSVAVNGHAVDRQNTVSALKLYTMTWANDVLALARSKSDISLKDLPMLHFRARSAYLLKRFPTEAHKRPLWKTLLYMHWPEVLFQSIFAIAQAAIQLAPQLAVYGLLTSLEQRNRGVVSVNTWLLVFSLGFSIAFASWADQWNAWIGHAAVALPIRSELSALVFAKATRRKDVSGSHRTESVKKAQTDTIPEYQQSGTSPETTENTHVSKNAALFGDAEKTRQSAINLVNVDVKLMSQFLGYHYIFLQIITKMVVSIIFLYKLLGWEPTLAGFATFFFTLPLNIWIFTLARTARGSLIDVGDRKMVIITEALQGIRQIKFSAREMQWQERILNIRDLELTMQWRLYWLDVLLTLCWMLGPILLSAVSLAVYAAIQGQLSASVAFTSIMISTALEYSLGAIPETTADAHEAWTSVQRIEKYLGTPERGDYTTPGHRIVFDNATLAWPSDITISDSDRFNLQDVNLELPEKELTVIGGQTGAGKSLLIASITGEADLLAGIIRAPRAPSALELYDNKVNKSDWIIDAAIAFVAQDPWIENTTIKGNVLFGLPFDKGRYNKVIDACGLRRDLEVLPKRDNTDIGFNGISLSVGARWRVSFARALYSRAGILILDDIFTAVDAKDGRQLFEEALTGELGQERTRILVTHRFDLCLKEAKYVVLLGDRTVKQSGSPEQLQQTGALDQIVNVPKELQDADSMEKIVKTFSIEDDRLRNVFSMASQRSKLIDSSRADIYQKSQSKNFTENEMKAEAYTNWEIYGTYLTAAGGIWYWLQILILYICHQGLTLGRAWFIGYWSRSYTREKGTPTLAQSYTTLPQSVVAISQNYDLSFYLGTYLGLSFTLCVTGTFRYFLVYKGSIRASKVLFKNMTRAILRAPVRWIDNVPVGRILNRFTSDFELIDSSLGGNSTVFFTEFVFIIGVTFVGVLVSPYIIPIALILLVVSAWTISAYLAGAREIKRLESVARSPIFELFGSTLTGIGTIRAFGKTHIYVEQMLTHIDTHARAFWHLWLLKRWVTFRLNVVGAIFTSSVAAVIVFTDSDASLAGFVLSFALQYANAVVWASRYYGNVELSMNAVGRVSEYWKVPIEQQAGRFNPPAAWPTEGRLKVSDLVVAYGPDLPPVLKGLSFQVEKNTRLGVIGRTGAGKSSLILALFRLLEAREGTILIDGINAAHLPLQVLRSRLAFIPQDPILFSGTVRSNLDPDNNHTDEELQVAMQRVHVSNNTELPSRVEEAGPSSSSTPRNMAPSSSTEHSANAIFSIPLNKSISESGLNLSQGQRQLLCLARAIVQRPKLLVLDEATSAVDMATHLLIQRSVRQEFQESTILVIARRLSTVADFDKILVMEEGKEVEFGSPGELLKQNDGVFKDMVEQSGQKAALVDIIEGGDTA